MPDRSREDPDQLEAIRAALEETEQRFRDIAENVRAVFWIRNTRTNEISYVSPAYEEIWGRPADELYRDPASWIDAIHPDDRARVRKAAIESEAASDYEAEYRIVRPDGAMRWIHDRALSLRASVERGEVVSGMAEDVTARRETETALADALGRARAAFRNTPVGSALFTLGSGPARVIEANPALCELVGYPEAELVGMSVDTVLHPDDQVEDGNWSALVHGEIDSYDVERRVIRADGRVICCRLRVSLVFGGDGRPSYGVAQLEDVTALKQAEARQAAIARLSHEALERASVDDLMHGAIEAIEATLGTVVVGILEHVPETGELFPRASGEIPPEAEPDMRRPAPRSPHLRAALDGRRPVVVADWEREARFERSDVIRRLGVRSSVAVPIQGPEGPWGVLVAHCRQQRRFSPDEVGFAQAIANVLGAGIQRRLSEEDARHRALHDPLTGLPNRVLLLDRLGHALDRSRRSGGEVAVLFLDLDHFKVINDNLGHEAGDRLLCALEPRLRETLRPSDTIARFGGDEFVVLCEDLPAPEDAAHLAERVLEGLREPFPIGGQELFTSATIGLALARDGATPESLVRDADAAMYRGKRRGRGRYELFDQAMRERVSARLRTENALRRALPSGALSLAFQPIVALDDGVILGAEALLRWDDAELGAVPPERFIPIAEESGLIVRIGEWVLQEAARLALAWPAPAYGAELPYVSVNLSARQVAHPAICERLSRVLERTGLPPGRLSLEITESVLMEEAEAPVDAVRMLKDLGVRLVLDDFGTGYSSLSYLNRLPIDVVKLDRSFIAPLSGDDGPTTAAIVSGMLTMAEALGLSVVAEGVEDRVQVEKLRALGCRYAQGFHFARPMPPEDLTALLRAGALPAPPTGERVRRR